MKKYIVENVCNCEDMKVDRDFFNGISDENIDKIREARYFDGHREQLEVTYKSGNVYLYNNIHGSWGQPIKTGYCPE